MPAIHDSPQELYNVYDWVGIEDFRESAVKSKRVRDEVFKRFEVRLPIATRELQKLVPGISLDHSKNSLRSLDAWLMPFVSQYLEQHASEIECNKLTAQKIPSPSATQFTGLTPFLRSVSTDLEIYYVECLQKVAPSLHWEPCDGKSSGNLSAVGFPGIVGSGATINYGQLGISLLWLAEFCDTRYSTQHPTLLSLEQKFDATLLKIEQALP